MGPACRNKARDTSASYAQGVAPTEIHPVSVPPPAAGTVPVNVIARSGIAVVDGVSASGIRGSPTPCATNGSAAGG